ncbi:MAG: GIY-YIG nuclease family protein [Roseburia sp.]|nr:GIY-YIG nuclease family protein [Roseburia sp.]
MNYYIYIMANKTNSVVYTGVTNNLQRRVYEHKNGLVEGFTKRYNVHKLVYAEKFENINDAIYREKQIKSWSRKRKNDLIESVNSEWTEITPF